MNEKEQMTGFKFIKKNVNEGVLLEVWQDMGEYNENTDCWKLVYRQIQKK